MLSQYVGSSIMHAKQLHATLRTHTRHAVRSFFPNRVYIYAREAMQQRHGRHLPKRKRLFLGCMRSLPAPAPQIFNETFFGKTSFLSSLPRKSRTERASFLIHGRSAVARKMPLNLTSLARVQLLSFSLFFNGNIFYLPSLVQGYVKNYSSSRAFHRFSQAIHSMAEELITG